jgi:hypothetical protein
VLAHMEEREGNLPFETQIQNLRALGPLDGAPESVNCWPPLVSLHLSLWTTLTCLSGFTLEP